MRVDAASLFPTRGQIMSKHLLSLFLKQQQQQQMKARAYLETKIFPPGRKGKIGVGHGNTNSTLLTSKGSHVDAFINHKLQMNVGEILSRVFTFWTRAGPIIVHYQWTQACLKTCQRTKTRVERDCIYQQLHERYAPHVLQILLDMKGLFIKLGQVLSSRPDFVPMEYVHKFSTLQDFVPPWDAKEMKAIVAQSLQTYHSLQFQDVFEHFEDEPLGSASIGQVHAATLQENFYEQLLLQNRTKDGQSPYSGGKKVAVKVMHRDAEDRFRYDFKIFKWLCRLALPGWSPFLHELERQMMTEFDYRREANNLRIAKMNIAKSPYRNKVVVPEPIEEISCPFVLVMEFLQGEKLAMAAESRLASILDGDRNLAQEIIQQKRQDLLMGKQPVSPNMLTQFHEAMHIIGYKRSTFSQARKMFQLASFTHDQKSILNLVLDVHGYQIFINGKFNGDPHPGNILRLSDGRLGLIDYGQFKTLGENERLAASHIVQLLGSSDRGIDDRIVSQAMRDFGFRFKYDQDYRTVRQTASLFFDSDAESRKLGFSSPQEYLLFLQTQDPILVVPDAAVFIARTSFLFRGMGALLGEQIRTCQRWSTHADTALRLHKTNL